MAVDFLKLTRAQLCRAVGKSGTTIDAWASAGCPRNSDGTFSLRVVFDWRVERNTPNPTSPERERLLRARASREELRLRREEGRSVDIEDAADVFGGVVEVLRQKILGLGDRLAVHVVGLSDVREAKQLIDRQTEDILFELSRTDISNIAQRREEGR